MAKAKPRFDIAGIWAGLRSRFSLVAVLALVPMGLLAWYVWSASGISNSGIRHNKELSDFGNKLLLLNAVRASKGYPLYFTTFGDAKASQTVQFTGTQKDAKIGIGGGVSDVSIISQNNAAFQKLMLAPLDSDLFQQFLKNDWPKAVLYNVFIQKIILDPESDLMIGNAVASFCRNAKHKGEDSFAFRRCGTLSEDLIFYRDYCGRNYRTPGRGNTRYYNAGDHECDQRRFQIFISELRIVGVRFKTETILPPTPLSVKKKTEKKEGDRVLEPVGFSDPNKATTRTVWIVGGRKGFSDLKEIEIDVAMRPPQEIIEYLGGLISAQLHIKNPFTPTGIYGGNFVRLPLFEVKCRASFSSFLKKLVGAPFQKNCSWPEWSNSAVSVEHEGVTYYIPKPKYGERFEARSLQVLELFQQVMIRQTIRGAGRR